MEGARERVLAAFDHRAPDRVPVADVLHNIDVIEHYGGEKVTPQNALDVTCRAVGRALDFARHFAVPDLEPRMVRDEDGFVYRLEWWTGQVLQRPFTAAGKVQFTTVPSGAVRPTGAALPSLLGRSGSKMLLTAMCT